MGLLRKVLGQVFSPEPPAPPPAKAAEPSRASYFQWFYDQHVWKNMQYHGIRTLKFPGDMWNYQEIIFEKQVDWVIEAGTRHGGSALFFANALMDRQAAGRVISMDIDRDARQLESHPHIDFLIGDSGSAEMVAQVQAMLPANRGPVFMILDSDHSKHHVLRELQAWKDFLKPGDYLIVEDTCVNGHPVRLDHGPGPYEAITEWLPLNPGKLRHDPAREMKFGATAAPMGYFEVIS